MGRRDGDGDRVRGFGFVGRDRRGPGFGEVERGVRVEYDFGDESFVGACGRLVSDVKA